MDSPIGAGDLNLCILYHAPLPTRLTHLPSSPDCKKERIAKFLGLDSSHWPEALQFAVFSDCRLVVVPLAHGIEPEERSKRVLSLILGVVKSSDFRKVADFTLCNQESEIARSSLTLIRRAVSLDVLKSLSSDKPVLLHTLFEISCLKTNLLSDLANSVKEGVVYP